MDAYWGPHFFGWMWIFPAMFLIICLGFVFTVLLRGPVCRMNRDSGRQGRGESARDILDKRFARGELTKEQHEDMKRVLDG